MTEQEYQAMQAQIAELEASIAAAETRPTFQPDTNAIHRQAHDRATRQIAGLRAQLAADDAAQAAHA